MIHPLYNFELELSPITLINPAVVIINKQECTDSS